MKRKNILLVFCIAFTILNNSVFSQKSSSSPKEEVRKVLNMNANWAFYRGDLKNAEKTDFKDDDWFAVRIPHSMKLEKKHNGGGFVFQGIGWYRRYFVLDKKEQGKRITLNFDGVQRNCEVYLNGKQIATHFGGYLGFVVDITDEVKFDKTNVLSLKVSSFDDALTPPGRPQKNLDFHYYGGIYRDVNLIITNKLYLSDPIEANKIAGGGLFVSYPNVGKERAEVLVKTHVINQTGAETEATVINIIKNKEGVEVAKSTSKSKFNIEKEFVQNLEVIKPKLWHPDTPYLYSLVTQIYNKSKLSDQKTTKIGIRTISFKSATGKADGFYINGEKLYLRGANRHQCYQNIGDAAPKSMQRRDAIQIKKGGFNSVRAAHYTQSPAFLDACDEIGLLVVECQPSWQFFNKDSVFVARSFKDVREMIRRDRNRPSVFLWETSLNESPTPAYWAKDAVEIAHQEMPNNQMFTADDFFANGRKYYDVSYKVINEDGKDPMPEKPSLTREWGDTWIADPAKENGLRASRIFTSKGLINQCVLRQNALQGTMLEEEGGYWDHAKLDANERMSGYFLWSYNDFSRGTDTITAFCGVVDIDRYEKFGYYQLKAMQSARNHVYVPMVFVASYNNNPEMDKDIYVFSNCDKVRLFRNDSLVGEKTRAENAKTANFVAAKGGSPYFKFSTKGYAKGTIKAEGFLDEKVVCSHTIKTPEEPDHLEIEFADFGIKPIADGSDIVPFYVKVCDKNGTIVNNKSQGKFKIDLQVTGNGKLIGENIPRIAVATQYTEGGIGYGMIRLSDRVGGIEVVANSANLKSAKASITSEPSTDVFVKDGNHAKWNEEIEKEVVESKFLVNKFPAELDISNAKIAIVGEDDATDFVNIIDKKTATVWKSKKNIVPTEINIELQKEISLQGSRIIWGKDSDWYSYSIEVSVNGNDWTNIIKDKKVSGQDYMPVLNKEIKVKYIKIFVSEIKPVSSRIAIKEITVFGNF